LGFGVIMDPEKTNTANNGLEWMLQNAVISDEALFEALTAHYYPEIYSFAFLLSGRQADSAGEAVISAISAAVKKRHRISITASLRSLLFSYTYRHCCRLKVRFQWAASLLPFVFKPETCREFYFSKDLEGLQFNEAVALALNYLYRFSVEEAASVQDLSVKSARNGLIVARVSAYHKIFPENLDPREHVGYINLLHTGMDDPLRMAAEAELKEHLEACPSCRAYAGRLPDLESHLAQAAIEAGQLSSAAGLREAGRPAWEKAGHQSQPRRLFPLKEIGLVGALLAGLILAGGAMGLFTPEGSGPIPTQAAMPDPTLTPTPGPLPPLVLEGEEGVDYFYFNYPVYNVETLETLSEKTGLSQDEIRALNLIEPGRPANLAGGREVRLVAFRESGWFDPPPRSNERLLAPPLTTSSSVEEVLERNRESDRYWQTLWAEYVYVNSPIPGVLARPDIVYFFQVWQAGTARGVVAAGGVMEAETYAVFQTGNWSFLPENRGYRGMWDSQSMGMFTPLFGGDITTAFGEIEFQPGQTKTIAGRQAVSLTGSLDDGQFDIWFDALTGIVLGFDFSDAFGEGAYLHLFTNRLDYDVLFPPGLFYPPTSPIKGLSTSFRGEPVQDPESIPIDWSNFLQPAFIEAYLSPPADLDLALTSIIFQKQDPASSAYEVFADEYYLGSLEIPLNIRACQRSPDGTQVLLTATSDLFFNEGREVYLLNLLSWEKTKIFESSYGTTRLAFSPDSSLLAEVNCGYPCRLNVYDLETGESRQFGRDYPFSYVQNLAWSPGGGQIAVLFSDSPSSGTVVVFDAESGEGIFTSSYHGTNESILTPGSPTEDWGIPFPTKEEILPCNQPVQP
jgi:DNA-directed RNA polymerase specialized sigma24 family protein